MEVLKKINCYYEGYNESKNRIDYLKYGLLNEYGINNRVRKEEYNEDKIIKRTCNKRV